MPGTSAQLSEQADRAAVRGDLSAARSLLAQAITADETGDVDLRLKLAAVCRAAPDARAALAATDAALELDPLHFVALLLRGSLLEQLGLPGADKVFGNALEQRPSTPLPPQLEAMAAHAQARFSAHQEACDAQLAAAVAGAVALDPEEERRIARLRSNALRLTKVYRSESTDYHLPELAEREFHDRKVFAWIERLEAETDVITAEFNAVAAAERAEIVPYVRYAASQPLRQWKTLNNSLDWSAIHLLQNGRRVEPNARHCPRTMALLADLPQPRIEGVSPNAMFSLLAPGAHIPPHTGVTNTRLVVHLPLIVPGQCWFRVGADRREWQPGEAWVFDDTIEHEAANESDSLRVILLFDIWHYGLSEGERRAVAALIAAHDRTGGHAAL